MKNDARLLVIELTVPGRVGSSSHDGVIIALLKASGLRVSRIAPAPATAFSVIETFAV